MIRPYRILIATSGFYPENSPRANRSTELAMGFARAGHSVTVITQDRGEGALNFCQNEGIRVKTYTRKLPTIRKCRTGVFGLFLRALSRGLLMFFEYPDIELVYRFWDAIKKEKDYDLLISVAVPYPVHWGVALARTSRTARCWVADCGDPYVGDESDSFRKLFYFSSIEKWMFRKADFISIPFEGAKRAYFSEFWSKIVIIPQGLDFNSHKPSLNVYQPNPIPTLAYAGTFIPGKRDPRTMLQYLIEYMGNYKFLVFTNTPALVLDYQIKSKGRIQVQAPLPRRELIEKLAGVDFLVNIANTSSVQLPSKLIDYHLTGRPVLDWVSGSSDFSKLVAFLNGHYDAALKIENLDQFRIENVCKQFTALIPNDHE